MGLFQISQQSFFEIPGVRDLRLNLACQYGQLRRPIPGELYRILLGRQQSGRSILAGVRHQLVNLLASVYVMVGKCILSDKAESPAAQIGKERPRVADCAECRDLLSANFLAGNGLATHCVRPS